MHVVLVLVNAIAEHLLALFGDGVNIVHHNGFLFAENRATGLTKGFEFVAEILDALLFQIVNEQDVGLGNIGVGTQSIIFAQNAVQ